MGPHEEFLELCAAATAGELSLEEQAKLGAHLQECSECRSAMKDYESIATEGVPKFSTQLARAEDVADNSWSAEDAEKRFLERLARERPVSVELEADKNSSASIGKRYTYRPSQIRWKEVWMPFAAAMLLAIALGVTLYKTGLRRGVDSARVVSNPTKGLEEAPRELTGEREELEAKLAQRDKTIEDLKRQLSEQKKAVLTLQSANLVPGKVADNQEPVKADVAKSRSADLAAARAKLTDLQKELDAATGERNEINNREAALEQQLVEASRLNKQHEHAIDEKDAQIANLEDLLEHDRDIRDLMGARELYMADVHDVGGKGTEKTYGRVFYTQGKSLIFYAFDLDAHPGVRNASAFQAWGRRGPDKQQARSLGIFFEDNASKKRWVLKADDPRTLEDIDAVFVTVEPNGGSQHPSGKQLLFAWLRVEPNHP
jgi:uncharacterized coiled-coil protein SlyX